MLKLTVLFYLQACLLSCGQANNNISTPAPAGTGDPAAISAVSVTSDTTKPVKENQSNKYYPFELQNNNGQYGIVANIESKELYPKYYDLFRKYGYEGNGYCWEGHIRQILEKLDKSLLDHIEFDPEAGTFFATADSKESQQKFVALLSPIFSDMKKLEEWVKKAERSRIDD